MDIFGIWVVNIILPTISKITIKNTISSEYLPTQRTRTHQFVNKRNARSKPPPNHRSGSGRRIDSPAQGRVKGYGPIHLERRWVREAA